MLLFLIHASRMYDKNAHQGSNQTSIHCEHVRMHVPYVRMRAGWCTNNQIHVVCIFGTWFEDHDFIIPPQGMGLFASIFTKMNILLHFQTIFENMIFLICEYFWKWEHFIEYLIVFWNMAKILKRSTIFEICDYDFNEGTFLQTLNNFRKHDHFSEILRIKTQTFLQKYDFF